MSSPIFVILRLLRDPDVSNKIILKFAFMQIKKIGYKKVLAMLLGALIVAVSSFIKIPQIKKVVAPETFEQRVALAEGISRNSVRMETLAQFIHVAYNRNEGSAFVNYGESFLLGIQNVVLLLVLQYYQLRKLLLLCSKASESQQRLETLRDLAGPAVITIGSVLFITRVAPRKLVRVLQLLCIPLAIGAKIPQIQRNAALQSTEHLSQITITANVIGSLIRVFTTLSNFDRRLSRDAILLAGYLTSFGLNSVLAGQIWKYSKKP